jgi:FtsP/CotA-like multicopper oxidase with cupredoxin domain
MNRAVRRGTLLAAFVGLSVLAGLGAVTSAQGVTAASSGLVCTTSPTAEFTLTAKAGRVSTPDGNTIYMWSYASGDGGFQLPGPNLCVDQGDTVSVTLRNTLPEPVSVIFPGQTAVTADGSPVQPQDAGGTLTSLAPPAPAGNGQVTYSFVADQPGTYIYESGTDMAKQVQMGLFGALIVRPTGHADRAYGDADTTFKSETEYVMLMSEVDPDLHHAVEIGQRYDITAYHPRYWMLNGRSFPDTILPNGSAALPTQPYSAFVHVQPADASNPEPALVRYLNVGTRAHPFHPHGNHGRVIARDGRPLKGNLGEDNSFEKFLVLVGPGQTWDVTYNWTDVEHWQPGTNPIPVGLPQQQNTTYKDGETWYSGSPYLGVTDDLPVGVTTYNECGEYYQMWHSHALNEAANYEAGFGGMTTLERIDPPGGCP